MREKYVCLEPPDNKVTIDFLGHDKKPRSCTINVTVENGKLHVYARGCDDRATILIDEEVMIPEEKDEEDV